MQTSDDAERTGEHFHCAPAAFLMGGVLVGTIAGKLLTRVPARPNWPSFRRCRCASNGRAARYPARPPSSSCMARAMRPTTEAPDIRRAKPSTISIPQAANALPQPIPLLGTDGIGGSFATRLGDILIQDGRYDRVIFVPLARGGASIAYPKQRGRGADHQRHRENEGSGPDADAYSVSAGRNGCGIDDDGRAICVALHQLVKRFRAAGFDAPFYLSRSTKCDYVGPTNIAAVRAGQLIRDQ